eukprot:jgi/Picre1/32365/NNA_007711.t1
MVDDTAARKSKLEELIEKKRQEQDDERERQRRQREENIADIDFGDGSDEDNLDPRPEAQGEQVSTEHHAAKHDDDEEEEGNEVPSQRDLDFIDDEGVSPEERIDFGDDENVVTFEEAEEAKDEMDEKLDGLFGRDTLRNSADAEINTQAGESDGTDGSCP